MSAAYTCQTCTKPCRAAVGDVLGLLGICEACQAKRFVAGTAAMKEAERKAAQS